MATLREIVIARKTVGERVAEDLHALETALHHSARQAVQCLGALLEAHNETALAPHTGMEIIEMMGEISNMTARSRAHIGTVHLLLRQVADDNKIIVGSYPDCPPNEG